MNVNLKISHVLSISFARTPQEDMNVCLVEMVLECLMINFAVYLVRLASILNFTSSKIPYHFVTFGTFASFV